MFAKWRTNRVLKKISTSNIVFCAKVDYRKAHKFNRETYLAFIDFKKVFDNINTENYRKYWEGKAIKINKCLYKPI